METKAKRTLVKSPPELWELAESGFGTAVSITAQHSAPDPGAAMAALEELLDELGSPERRPFTRA